VLLVPWYVLKTAKITKNDVFDVFLLKNKNTCSTLMDISQVTGTPGIWTLDSYT
jgi:hypothetical protein